MQYPGEKLADPIDPTGAHLTGPAKRYAIDHLSTCYRCPVWPGDQRIHSHRNLRAGAASRENFRRTGPGVVWEGDSTTVEGAVLALSQRRENGIGYPS